jgi:hypothetical protein
MFPAAAADPNGKWTVGYVDEIAGGYNGIGAGGVISPSSPSQVSYIAAGAMCPPPTIATDPARAMQFHGTPVCMDHSQKGVLVPYAAGACTHFINYAPQLFGGGSAV